MRRLLEGHVGRTATSEKTHDEIGDAHVELGQVRAEATTSPEAIIYVESSKV